MTNRLPSWGGEEAGTSVQRLWKLRRLRKICQDFLPIPSVDVGSVTGLNDALKMKNVETFLSLGGVVLPLTAAFPQQPLAPLADGIPPLCSLLTDLCQLNKQRNLQKIKTKAPSGVTLRLFAPKTQK